MSPQVQGQLTALLATSLSVPPSSVTLEAMEAVDECEVAEEASSAPIAPVVGDHFESTARSSSEGASAHLRNSGGSVGNGAEVAIGNAPVPLSPIQVVATGGTDDPTCGGMEAPCATLRYAVNTLANAVAPPYATVPIILGPGAYGPDSCGANATRPMSITGAGSAATRIDCQGTGRALAASDSLWLTGMTVTGGFANVSVVVFEGILSGVPFAAGGGGAVAIVWPTALSGASAVVIDVAFMNNYVVGVVSGQFSAASAVVGGGGLYIAGGGSDSVVTVQNCSFVGNVVNVTDYTGVARTCGGGVCVVAGLAPSPVASSSLSNVAAAVIEVVASNNVIACTIGCSLGWWLILCCR
jgi:hypothetical protein